MAPSVTNEVGCSHLHFRAGPTSHSPDTRELIKSLFLRTSSVPGTKCFICTCDLLPPKWRGDPITILAYSWGGCSSVSGTVCPGHRADQGEPGFESSPIWVESTLLCGRLLLSGQPLSEECWPRGGCLSASWAPLITCSVFKDISNHWCSFRFLLIGIDVNSPGLHSWV